MHEVGKNEPKFSFMIRIFISAHKNSRGRGTPQTRGVYCLVCIISMECSLAFYTKVHSAISPIDKKKRKKKRKIIIVSHYTDNKDSISETSIDEDGQPGWGQHHNPRVRFHDHVP